MALQEWQVACDAAPPSLHPSCGRDCGIPVSKSHVCVVCNMNHQFTKIKDSGQHNILGKEECITIN